MATQSLSQVPATRRESICVLQMSILQSTVLQRLARELGF